MPHLLLVEILTTAICGLDKFSHQMGFRLRFPPKLEESFRREHERASADQVRWLMVMVIGLIILTAPSDLIIGPSVSKQLLLHRFTIVLPGTCLIWALTKTRLYEGRVQLFTFLFVSYGALNFVQALRLLKPEVVFAYHGTTAVGLFLIYALFRLRFWWATAAAVVNIIVYNSILFSSHDVPNSTAYSIVSGLLVFNALGMVVVYVLERNWRRSFLLTFDLQQSESRNRTLLKSNPDALLVVNGAGELSYASPAIESFFDSESLRLGITALWPDEAEQIETAIEECQSFDHV
jgi:PAS domain-containing protein